MIGLSDHTPTIDTSLASIPLGVVTIEKHFKESDKNKSVDSTFSILPKDLNELKEKSIIYFNATKPNNNKETNRADLTAARSKRSIFAQNDIKKNEKNKTVTASKKRGTEKQREHVKCKDQKRSEQQKRKVKKIEDQQGKLY